jgi:hypothetical protein
MTAQSELQIGSEMYSCPDCRLYDADTYCGPEIRYWTLLNGNSMNIGGMSLQLSSSFIPCKLHAAKLAELFPDG